MASRNCDSGGGQADVPELDRIDPMGEDEDELDDDDDRGGVSEMYRTLHCDPWGRWPAGSEPVRELEVVAVWADVGDTLLHRQARVEVPPGSLPTPTMDADGYRDENLNFRGRWNATWKGSRLSSLSLDCFSEHLDWVVRLVFSPDHPADLLAAYETAFPGLWGLNIIAEDFTSLNRRQEILGHQVSARDPRLAIQIASRYPGVCDHTAWMERELYRPTEIQSEKAAEIFAEIDVTASLDGERAPGARLAADPTMLHAFAVMQSEESEKPFIPFLEPIGATLDTYTLVGAHGLGHLDEATLVRVPADIVSALSANVTFADAITAIRCASVDRLPLWLDFTDDDGEPFRLRRPGGPDQPLYGVMVAHYTEEDDPDTHSRVVVPVGRAAGCVDRPIPLCGLGIGPDDRWRYPMPKNVIGLLSAHRGGVVVRHIRTHHDLDGANPVITERELNRELAGYVARATEWILARVGAVLSGLDSGALHYEKVTGTQRTFSLVRAPAPPAASRAARALDGRVLVGRLRELGSVGRVSEAVDADIIAVREALDRIGVDPDQVRRDEALVRFRQSGSIEAVVAALHIHRSDIERFLTEAGIDWLQTAVPHDVTDPDVLAAIAAYREAGTLDGAGEMLGVSGETVRRRLALGGLKPEEILTEARRRVLDETVEAWKAEGSSLAGAARRLGVDPRTVRDRLRQADVSTSTISATGHKDEMRRLWELTGSVRAVAALMGVSPSTVRRGIGRGSVPAPRRVGRPRVSDDALDQVELAFAEHGSIRAAARAIGMSPGGFNHRLQLARARAEQQGRSESVTAGNPKRSEEQ